MSAATDKVLTILADGQWHPLHEIVDQLAVMMPPGAAYRRSEQGRRRRQRARNMPVTERQRGDKDSAIAAGQRIAAREVVRGLRDRGRVEERTRGGKEVRAR